MRTTTLYVAERHFQELDHKIAFRHDWKGDDMFWIVPKDYVLSCKLKDGMWTVRLFDGYFTLPTSDIRAA